MNEAIAHSLAARHTYKKTDDYHVELEYFGEDNCEVALHISISNWSPRVYKELLGVWIEMEELLIATGYTRIFGMLPKENKDFVYMFGWELSDQQFGKYIIAFKELV